MQQGSIRCVSLWLVASVARNVFSVDHHCRVRKMHEEWHVDYMFTTQTIVWISLYMWILCESYMLAIPYEIDWMPEATWSGMNATTDLRRSSLKRVAKLAGDVAGGVFGRSPHLEACLGCSRAVLSGCGPEKVKMWRCVFTTKPSQSYSSSSLRMVGPCVIISQWVISLLPAAVNGNALLKSAEGSVQLNYRKVSYGSSQLCAKDLHNYPPASENTGQASNSGI